MLSARRSVDSSRATSPSGSGRSRTTAGPLRAFFGSGAIATLSDKLPEFVSAIHAYEVTEALTYVTDGKVLPHYQT